MYEERIMYHVYGYDTETGESCLLKSLWSEKEAIDWAIKYVDFHNEGWNKVCVQYERQIDVDVTEEYISWSYYNEPMGWSDNAKEEF